MKACVISQYFPPDTGGASTRASNLIDSLVREHEQVTVVTAFPHYPKGMIPRRYRGKLLSVEEFRGARVVRVWIPPIAHEGVVKRLVMYTIFALSSLTALPFCRGSKITWAVSPNYLCMIPATAVRLVTKSRIVHDVVDIWPQALIATGYTFPWGILESVKFLSRISYILSDAIVTLSDSMRADLLAASPKTTNIEVITNCVGNDFFSVQPKEMSDSFHVMYVGTLSLSNDFPTLLRAAKTLLGDKLMRFTIAGSGELGSEISQLVNDDRITNVNVVGHSINHNEVPNWIAQSDALIVPLRKGFGDSSFPSKLGEYLASGRPVVCTTDGILSQNLRSNNISLIVEPGDVEGLVDPFSRLKSDHALRLQLATRGRAYAKEHFSFASFQERVEQLTESVSKTP